LKYINDDQYVNNLKKRTEVLLTDGNKKADEIFEKVLITLR
jgi:formiminotetrahydrofolate cyclodeaminase